MGQKVAKGVHYVMGDPPVLTEEDVLVERRGVVWNVDGTLKSCIYCDYASKKKEKEILYADDLVVIFAPRKKAAKQHVLVVPHQRHITQIGEFFSSDVHVLDHMRSVTEDFMKKNGADPESKIQMSFFISPWNSVGKFLSGHVLASRARINSAQIENMRKTITTTSILTPPAHACLRSIPQRS